MKDWLTRYFSSWWRPAAVTVGLLITLIASDLTLSYLHITNTAILSNTLFVLFLIALLTVLGGAVYQFVISAPTLTVSMIFSGLLGPSEDGFGKDITIPADMAYDLPRVGTRYDRTGNGLYMANQNRLVKDTAHNDVTQDDPEIHITNGVQGGIYLVHAYVNPGELGVAYLKVFEATRNTRLSEFRITKRSRKKTRWSDDPYTQFLYNTEITVYEGDWGVYYPARFELWFVPASGGPERKLFEKIFRIEGWMR
jgi:hypothetical protein